MGEFKFILADGALGTEPVPKIRGRYRIKRLAKSCQHIPCSEKHGHGRKIVKALHLFVSLNEWSWTPIETVAGYVSC